MNREFPVENTPGGRRKRAAILRQQNEEKKIINELKTNYVNESEDSTFENGIKQKEKIKRTRMQNSKGTSGMFIKP